MIDLHKLLLGQRVADTGGRGSIELIEVLERLVDAVEELQAGQAPSYTVATVPPATTAARIIYVSDEAGGAVLAFSDGTNWRRVTDRAVIS